MAHARAERAQAVSGGSKMAEAPVFGLLLRMSLPLMLSMMIQALYNIVDSVFIGMLPERAEALQALGYAYPIQMLLVAGGVGTGIGVNALSFPFALLNIMLASALQGLGSGVRSMIVALLRLLVVLMPACFLFGKSGGIDALWWGALVAEAVALVYASFATVAVYRRTMRESSAAPDSPAGTDAGTTPGTEGAHDPF